MDLALGGVGGVYFLAEPGELLIEVQKRDRNRGRAATELRAILAGPDRRVLQEATIPDDGRPAGSGLGPVQRVRLSAQVPRRGVYALNITVSNDRYGEAVVWGFTTNCPRHMIETARGHKDERHQEPIVLWNPGRPCDVVFRPRRETFCVEVAGLPKDSPELVMYDGQGRQVGKLAVAADGRVTQSFPASDGRAATPWRLHLPSQEATIHIDGVTRWETSDRMPNHACWTNRGDAWFPLLEYRWLLTPYHRMLYAAPGSDAEVRLHVRNSLDRPQTIALSVEFPQAAWPARVSPERIDLPRGQSAEVTVRCQVPPPGPPRVCHVRATPAGERDFSTYSTIEVFGGTAPATRPLTMPLTLQPYRHENELFGYLPDYPVDYQFYFDSQNRPLAWTDHGIARYDGQQWTTADLAKAVRTVDGAPLDGSLHMATTKITSDRQGRIYALAARGRRAFLLCSSDGGRTFSAAALPGRATAPCSYDFEQFSGRNELEGPPPILRYVRTGEDPKLIWRKINDLELILPRWQDQRLVLDEPIRVTRNCIGLAAHSGIPATVVSRGSRVHLVWGEATDPQDKVPGVPAFVATYDRTTRRLSEPALVGHGPPANDVHNTPSITIDGWGYLHVLVGTHGQPFVYARSLAPNDAAGGWTPPEKVGANLRQTYIGLVCGPDDVLHAVFRYWKQGEPPFPLSHHATLAHQRKRPDGPWEEPQVLIVAPFSEYSVFYHRLTIDHTGRLWLSYDYWSTFWFYRNDQPGHRRAMLVSADGGKTWKLPGREDLLVARRQ
jgi:hypothetical protein